MLFTIEGFLKVATKNCPWWDLNSQTLNSIQTL